MNLIFCGNLHNGGGVQVATSFIQELVINNIGDLKSLDVIMSSAVENEIRGMNIDLSAFRHVYVMDFFGIKKDKRYKSLNGRYNFCFVIFGPIYYSLNADRYVVGFAQPWIAYKKNDAYLKLNLISKLKNKLFFYIKDLIFRRYDNLVVEHEHVKTALLNQGYKSKIYVVSNTYSSVFDNEDSWEIVNLPGGLDRSVVTFGYVGRSYDHKNLGILKEVNYVLLNKYNINVNFLFTLNKDEMRDLGFEKISNFYSTGSISLKQCPNFYRQIDALIFPSMLECFSATPIEAMKMNVPVYCSDYPFLRGICQNASFYFDALSSENIAKVIAETIGNKNIIHEKIYNGMTNINNLPSSYERAVAYMNILTNIKASNEKR